MGIGSVTVSAINNNQGEFTEAERVFLYIGEAAIDDNDGEILAISGESDLDELFGEAASELKTQLAAAIANAQSDTFAAYAIPYAPLTDDWKELLDNALEAPNDLKIEGVVLCTPVTTSAQVTGIQTELSSALTKYAKYLCCFVAVSGIDPLTETWAQYKTRVKAIINGIAAPRVSVAPQLHGNNLGVVCGRLCNPAVSIADTPMRVATGALIGLGEGPVDSAGKTLTMADMLEFATARFSVPQWYNGYNGMYWADMMMLDNDGGDFQVYENLRVLDYLARRVRILAIARIADRRLNSTPASIASNKTYFMRPLREASRTITINGEIFPSMIRPPEEGDITITWISHTEVLIGIVAAPYSCPKKIKVYLALDLNRDIL